MVRVVFVMEQGYVFRPGGGDGEAVKVLAVGSVDQMLVVAPTELFVLAGMDLEPATQLHGGRHLGGAEFDLAQFAEFGDQVEGFNPDPDAVGVSG